MHPVPASLFFIPESSIDRSSQDNMTLRREERQRRRKDEKDEGNKPEKSCRCASDQRTANHILPE